MHTACVTALFRSSGRMIHPVVTRAAHAVGKGAHAGGAGGDRAAGMHAAGAGRRSRFCDVLAAATGSPRGDFRGSSRAGIVAGDNHPKLHRP